MIEQIERKRRNVESSFLHLMTNIHRKQRFAFYSVESTIEKKTNKIEKASGVRKKSEWEPSVWNEKMNTDESKSKIRK